MKIADKWEALKFPSDGNLGIAEAVKLLTHKPAVNGPSADAVLRIASGYKGVRCSRYRHNATTAPINRLLDRRPFLGVRLVVLLVQFGKG